MLEDIPCVKRMSFVKIENGDPEQELPYSVIKSGYFSRCLADAGTMTEPFTLECTLHAKANSGYIYIEEMECGGVKRYGKLTSTWNIRYLHGLVHPFIKGITRDYSDINVYKG